MHFTNFYGGPRLRFYQVFWTALGASSLNKLSGIPTCNLMAEK